MDTYLSPNVHRKSSVAINFTQIIFLEALPNRFVKRTLQFLQFWVLAVLVDPGKLVVILALIAVGKGLARRKSANVTSCSPFKNFCLSVPNFLSIVPVSSNFFLFQAQPSLVHIYFFWDSSYRKIVS